MKYAFSILAASFIALVYFFGYSTGKYEQKKIDRDAASTVFNRCADKAQANTSSRNIDTLHYYMGLLDGSFEVRKALNDN
jgi:hypothetical protein